MTKKEKLTSEEIENVAGGCKKKDTDYGNLDYSRLPRKCGYNKCNGSLSLTVSGYKRQDYKYNIYTCSNGHAFSYNTENKWWTDCDVRKV